MAKIAGQVSHLSDFKALQLVLFNGWGPPCRRGPGFGVHLDIGCEELFGFGKYGWMFFGGLPVTGTHCILLMMCLHLDCCVYDGGRHENERK